MDCAHYCCNSVVKGYHVYQDIWEASHGEVLSYVLHLLHDTLPAGTVSQGQSLSDLLSNASCCGLIFMDDRQVTKIYMPTVYATKHWHYYQYQTNTTIFGGIRVSKTCYTSKVGRCIIYTY